MRAEGVVLLRISATKERATVMDLLTAGSMMAMPDVKEILSAEVTTARSSGRIITLEMIAVRSQPAQAAALTGECKRL